MDNEKNKTNFYNILGIDRTASLRYLKIVYIKKLERMKNTISKGETQYSLSDITLLNKAYLGLCSPLDRYLHNCYLDETEPVVNSAEFTWYKNLCEGNCDFSVKDESIFVNLIDDIIISLSMEVCINTEKDMLALRECLESLEAIKEKLREKLKNKLASKTFRRRK